MKKSFFKKLSFILALAMIVSILAPAAGAFAAAKPALNSAKKYLFLGEDGRNEFDFNIKNKVSGSKYAWKSADEDVAVVDKANGLTTAVGVGKTTVSVVITKKGAKAVTLKATVIVKDNIKEVKISNAPDKAITVGDEYDFNRSYTTFGGSSKKTTSVTRWIVDKADKATINDSGVFKATEAGTYNVTALSFQSVAKYDAWKALNDPAATLNVLDTDTAEIKVANKITSLAQVDLTSFKVTFTAPVEKLAVADVAVSYIVAATKTLVPQVVKSVTLSDDKKSATVVLYNKFNGSSSYQVEIADFDKQEFVAATTNVADVDRMEISPATATVQTSTDVLVKLFNKDGVDITTPDLMQRVTTSSSSEKVYYDTANKKVTIYNVGDTTTITGVFHTWVYDNTTGKELDTVTTSIVITGVTETTTTVGNIAAWTIAPSYPSDSFATVNHVIPAGANDGSLKLFVNALKTDGKTYVSNDTTNASKFKFESSNNNVLIVSGNALYPVKEGSASVLVKYCDNLSAVNPTWTVVGALPVTVGASAVASSLVFDTDVTFTLSNDSSLADNKTVGIAVKDQYGNNMTVSGVTVTRLSVNTSDLVKGGAQNVASNATSLVFEGAGKATGSYTYEVKANNIVRWVTVTINAPSSETDVAYYKLNVDKTAYDVKLTTDDLSETAIIKIIGYAANNVANEQHSVTGAGLTLKLYKADGTDVTSYLNTSAVTSASIALAVGAPGGNATKIATGTYTVKLFDGSVVKDAVTFEVKDSSVLPVVTVAKIEASTSSNDITKAINECFTVAVNGTTITNGLYVTNDDIIGRGTTVSVKNVRYRDSATGAEFVITVNTYIDLGFTYAPN